MKKYKTNRYGIDIEEIEVVSETEKTVVVAALKSETGWNRREHRESKVTEWHTIHDTWEAAVAYLKDRTQRQLIGARAKVEELEEWFARLEHAE